MDAEEDWNDEAESEAARSVARKGLSSRPGVWAGEGATLDDDPVLLWNDSARSILPVVSSAALTSLSCQKPRVMSTLRAPDVWPLAPALVANRPPPAPPPPGVPNGDEGDEGELTLVGEARRVLWR